MPNGRSAGAWAAASYHATKPPVTGNPGDAQRSNSAPAAGNCASMRMTTASLLKR